MIVTPGEAAVVSTFAAVLDALPSDCVLALDMPIGLLDAHETGGRECDRAARKLLGRTRAASVFSPPPRCALGARTLSEAQRLGARITLQTLNILPKIEEVDARMTPRLNTRVHEVHPELAFAALNRGTPVAANKKTAEGRVHRQQLLEQAGITVPAVPRGAAADDLLDACALLWSAFRIANNTFHAAPDNAPLDARGLRMQIRW